MQPKSLTDWKKKKKRGREQMISGCSFNGDVFGQTEGDARMIDVQKWTRPSKLKLDESWNSSHLNTQKPYRHDKKGKRGERVKRHTNEREREKKKKTFSRVKCMNYTHKARQKWRWRVWLQSRQRWCWLTDRCVDENVNNGTYLSDLILKGQREKVQNDLFVVLLLSLTVIYFEKHIQ